MLPPTPDEPTTLELQTLLLAMDRHAVGDVTCRLPADSFTRIGPVVAGFNRVLAAHEQAQRELRRYAQQLEEYHAQAELQARELQVKNEELEAAKCAALQASETKSAFVANMSHEIRTPMTAVLGYTDLLLDDEDSPPERPSSRRQALETIRRNGQHLLQLLNDILDVSKIEAGKLAMERMTCSPTHIVADVVNMMQFRARERGIALEAACVGKIPEVIYSDPTRVKQILINLVGNAIKFTHAGAVRIEVSCDLVAAGRFVMRFEVIDTGIGMTPEQTDSLFQPFTQADSSMTRRYGGTGLGLTISKRLAELLGGGLTAVSRLDQGSTFTATVATGPLDNVRMIDASRLTTTLPPSATAKPAVQTPSARLSGRILLAEDGADNQRLISLILEKAGAEVRIADNGRSAVELVANRSAGTFDLILMDIQMPLMDGYEATRRLRAAGFNGPIVALTAYAMRADREKALAAGCNDFAAKPIDRASFLATVKRWLGAPVAAPLKKSSCVYQTGGSVGKRNDLGGTP